MHMGKATNAIVWQNIALAFGVKIIVLVLGAWRVASMWEAVFADVGSCPACDIQCSEASEDEILTILTSDDHAR